MHWRIITSADRRKLCFHLCLFCLFVCLWTSLRKTRKQIFMTFSVISRVWWKEKSRKVRGVTRNPLSSVFSRKSVSVSNILRKGMNGFSWNFQQSLHMGQVTNWNILGMLWLTPWIQDWFFHFLDPCLLVMLGKTDERMFMKLSWNVRVGTRINRLDCFTPDKTVSWSPIWAQGRAC